MVWSTELPDPDMTTKQDDTAAVHEEQQSTNKPAKPLLTTKEQRRQGEAGKEPSAGYASPKLNEGPKNRKRTTSSQREQGVKEKSDTKERGEPQPKTFLLEVQTAERRQGLRLSKMMVGIHSSRRRGTKNKKKQTLPRY